MQLKTKIKDDTTPRATFLVSHVALSDLCGARYRAISNTKKQAKSVKRWKGKKLSTYFLLLFSLGRFSWPFLLAVMVTTYLMNNLIEPRGQIAYTYSTIV